MIKIEEQREIKRQRKNPITFLSFPDEILINITSQLSQKDTLSLLYSNKRFERACKVRLYKNIVLIKHFGAYHFKKLANYNCYSFIVGGNKILALLNALIEDKTSPSGTSPRLFVEQIITYEKLFNFYSQPGSFEQKVEELWIPLTNCLKNLKVFISPRTPHSYIFLMNKDIAQNLSALSISSKWFSKGNYQFNLKAFKLQNLKKLKLNDGVTEPNFISMFLELLIIDGQHSNTSLEEIEINPAFGFQDLSLDEKLSDRYYTEDTNLLSSFLLGNKDRHRLADVAYRGSPNFEDDTSSILNLWRSREIIDDVQSAKDIAERQFIMSHRAVKGPKSINTRTWNENAQVVPQMLKNISFQFLHDRDLSILSRPEGNDSEMFSLFLKSAEKLGLSFPNIKKLVISNMVFKADHFLNYNTEFWRLFNTVFPNFHEKVEILQFRNIVHKPLTGQPSLYGDITDQRLQQGWEVIERANSFLTCFIQEQKSFPRLKKMTFFSAPYEFHIERAVSERETRIAHDVSPMNPFVKYSELLIDFTLLAPALEELDFVAPKSVEFKHFVKIITLSPRRGFFKKLSFISYDDIISIITKILNLKIFKRFNMFDDFKKIDNYHYLCSRIVKEHFISATKTEDYEGQDCLKNDKDALFFKDEFHCLFREDAQTLFKICPRLTEATFYGFTFYKEEMNYYV
ncbi:hypothetical protein BN7_3748 [Wickerhamomyces ciferrii]|uniref:F-box domain-containing protein n=1 Tax=Wickerhamomyces ciferrii (strain ATCC 14091 / BCRC 22168 / CBS 111 / JCM 3599 / NBRC 0793 / NRRL Y-1031 F-60-10) TaxID=1206466 RepID=K0KS79_WICCF|nr:uncharacterized protein BN7_3748 [Wickerhamomyces ciferrii]CCH44189.1 hypothetical protein BN7_3748 [Wickerhamomyces ciferrii]